MANIANFLATAKRFPVRVYEVVVKEVFLFFTVVVILLLAITRLIEHLLLMIFEIMVKYNPAVYALLHISLSHSWIDDLIARILIVRPDSVREADSKGWLPVHTAAFIGTVEIMEKLLELYPESASLLNPDGHNLLHLAVHDAGNTMKAKVRFLCSKYPAMMGQMNAINFLIPLKLASFIN